ncbi:MAG TPA: hypothetical protein VNB24_07260 [Acidimicrobiales bacterium]|nr:hypothetical protein [Acidimicrobiales bacterium]
MANVTVSPTEFHFVTFDAAEVTRLVTEVADLVGLPSDLPVHVAIDETTPLGRTRVASLDPVTLEVEGGAFENAKAPRTLSERSVRDVAARLLFRVSDRLSPDFADAPADEELTLAQTVAWDVYAVGRAARAGLTVSKPRRLYHFRNRHGFNDVADAAFERLWAADGFSWAELDAICQETQTARV